MKCNGRKERILSLLMTLGILSPMAGKGTPIMQKCLRCTNLHEGIMARKLHCRIAISVSVLGLTRVVIALMVSWVPDVLMENFKPHKQQRCRDDYDAFHDEV
jgi:hypothetical protein